MKFKTIAIPAMLGTVYSTASAGRNTDFPTYATVDPSPPTDNTESNLLAVNGADYFGGYHCIREGLLWAPPQNNNGANVQTFVGDSTVGAIRTFYQLLPAQISEN